jgi:bacterioferritin
MTGDPSVLELLNDVLTAELTAINQYFVDSKMCANWGFPRMAKHFYEESIDEMKDADDLIERLLYLDGIPNLQRLGTVRVGEDVKEKLELALQLEREAIVRLNAGIATCLGVNDNGTRELLEHILEGEEEHADWLESQLSAIGTIGIENYLSQMLHGDDD